MEIKYECITDNTGNAYILFYEEGKHEKPLMLFPFYKTKELIEFIKDNQIG